MSSTPTPVSATPATSPSLWQQFTGWVDTEFQTVLSFLQNFFTTTIQSEVTVLQPFAEQAVADIAGALPAIGGGLKAFVEAVAPALLSTATAAEAAGVQAAGASLLTAVGGAVANAQAAVPTTAVAAPAADTATSAAS